LFCGRLCVFCWLNYLLTPIHPPPHRFGVTATTGQLADNHDILSFVVHDSHVEGKLNIVKQNAKLDSMDDVTKLVHDLEHQLTNIYEKLQNTIEKLSKQEDLIEARVKELEKEMKESVTKDMSKRMEDR